MSRYAKLEAFFRASEGLGDIQLAMDGALERFAAAARQGLASCPLVPGVAEHLARLAARRTPMHVVSGGDQAEVREALTGRGLASYFRGIHGSPTRKRVHVERLRDAGELLAGGVYYGDARLDMELAEAFGLAFVFVAGVSDWPAGRSVAAARGHRVVEDFRGLSSRRPTVCG